MLNRILGLLVLVFLIGDLGYSFLHYADAPIDGDLPAVVLPGIEEQKVLDDPFGFHVLISGDGHSGTNRYFMRALRYQWFNHLPQAIQSFTSPVESIYIAAGMLKLLIHIVGVIAATLLARSIFRITNLWLAVVALLTSLCFQHSGYIHTMGMIDPAVTYAVAYGGTVFLFFIWVWVTSRLIQRASILYQVLSYLILLVLSFAGALGPAMILVALVTYLIFLRKTHGNIRAVWQALTARQDLVVLAIGIVLLASYSLWLGSMNTENQISDLSIIERYLALPVGLFKMLSHNPGLLYLLLGLALNAWLLSRFQNEQNKLFRQLLLWVGIFSVIFILLLPLGGFRDYRPYVVRRDTLLPLIFLLTFLFSVSSVLILSQQLTSRWKLISAAAIGAIAIIFFVVDIAPLGRNACQRGLIKQLQLSDASPTVLDSDGLLMTWDPVEKADESAYVSAVLVKWNILQDPTLFTQSRSLPE